MRSPEATAGMTKRTNRITDFLAQVYLKRSGNVPEPFPIRGHHLRNFRYLLESGHTGRQHAEEVRRAQGSITLVDAFQSEEFIEEKKSSIKDTYGPNIQTADVAENESAQVYSDFLRLRGRDLVRITEGSKDGLCNACCFGEHCSWKRTYEGDREFVDLFISKVPARKRRMTKKIVTFSDGEQQTARVILTTARVVKKAIRDSRFKMIEN